MKYSKFALISSVVTIIGIMLNMAWFPTVSASVTKNLIENPGFENGSWQSMNNVSVSSEQAHYGNKSVKMQGVGISKYCFSNDIAVDINAVYSFSSWIKTENVLNSEGAYIRLQYLDQNRKNLSPMRTIISAGGTEDWSKFSYDINKFNEGTVYIRVYCYLASDEEGVAWFDDISLVKDESLLQNPGFESGEWSLKQDAQLDTTVKHTGANSAKFISSSTRSYYGTELIAVDRFQTYTLSAWIKTDGVTASEGAYLQVQQIKADNTNIAMGEKRISTTGTKDWSKFTVRIDDFNENTAYVRIYVNLQANAGGTVWFDDITFMDTHFAISSTTPLGGMYTNSTPMNFGISIKEHKGIDSHIDVFYTVKDWKENVLYQNKTMLSINANQEAEIDIDLSKAEKNGTYTLELNAQSSYVGELINIYHFSITDHENQQNKSDKFGMCTHFAHSGKGDHQINLPLISQIGAGWIRDEMYWGAVESEKGVYAIPERFEKYVDFAVEQGLEVLLILNGNNSLYGSMPPSTEEAITGYANYCAFVADYFKGRVGHFEIWNEYNNSPSFNPSNQPPETYAKMIEAAYPAIKAANNEAVVIGGSTARVDLAWLKRVFDAGGYDYMDAVSVHPYCYPDSPDGTFIQSLTKVHDLIKLYGEDKPVWATEMGYPTHINGCTERDSASNLVKTYVLALSSDVVSRILWYDFQDDGLDVTDQEHNFGIIRYHRYGFNSYTAKEPFIAHSNVIEKLNNTSFVDEVTTDKIRVFKFRRESDNKDILVIWPLTDSGYITLKSDCAEVACYDIMGNEKALYYQNSGVTVKLKNEPIYIEGEFPEINILECETDANLIINSSFENKGWSLWQNAGIDNRVSRTGKSSAKLSGTTNESYYGTGFIPIDRDYKYILSAWIKTDNVLATDGAFLQIQQIDGNKANLGMGARRIATGKTKDWTQYTFFMENFNQDTQYVRIYIKLSAGESGTAWFDDISFVKMDKSIKTYIKVDEQSKQIRGTVWSLNDVVSPTVIYGEYENNRLINVQKHNISILPKGVNEINIETTFNGGKIFLWEATEHIKPLDKANKIFFLE